MALRQFLTAFILVVWPALVQADNSATFARVQNAYQTWLEERGAKGALAILRHGKAPLVSGHGMDPEVPVDLASLSKAITAICAAELVGQGTLEWDSRFSDVVGDGPDATLAQLVTHSAGFGRDGTQRLMRRNLDRKGAHISDLALARLRDGGKPGVYRYSNDHYALIALMIEAATGRDYEPVCREAAIAPANVTASAAPRTGAFLPWGGWQMTVGDHARWHAHWFGPLKMEAPLPRSDLGEGVNYGLGALFRELGPGNTYWHFGAQCFPGRYNAGAFVSTLFGKLTLVAAYDICVNDLPTMISLDAALIGALSGGGE